MKLNFSTPYNSAYISVPKSLATAPVSIAAKGLFLEILLSEGQSREILANEQAYLNELLTVGFLKEVSRGPEGLELQISDVVTQPQRQPVQPTQAIPVVDSSNLKAEVAAHQQQAMPTFGCLYNCLTQLPLKGKLPNPTYHKLRAQILHWVDQGIDESHIKEAHRWLVIEKGDSRFINWWDIDGQIWEVKALSDRNKESQQSRGSLSTTGVNGHLHKRGSSDPFMDNLTQKNHDIQQVFDYWQQKTQMRGELTLERVRVIRNALNSFSVNDLKLAVDGAMTNDYCLSKGLLSVGDIYRSTDIIAKHIHQLQKPVEQTKMSPAEQAINIALDDFVSSSPAPQSYSAKVKG